ncbi:MAG: hypothetical protein J5742_00640 [Alphaproteobacteria bacterium]|nr:hypothetical protein [Alphaproteobacteria bacterium]
MKTKILFLSSMICISAIMGARASDYIAPDSDVQQYGEVYQFDVEAYECRDCDKTNGRQIELVSFKQTPADKREPVFDGSTNKYKIKGVTWENGVPVWHDSIAKCGKKKSCKCKSCENELAKLYTETLDSIAETRARIEELLTPKQQPEEVSPVEPSPCSIAYTAQDLSVPINIAFGNSDGCPFETDAECKIWRRKPIVRETVSPRSPKIRDDKMYEFLSELRCSGTVDANSPTAAPLVERYKMLMQSARACCTEGMIYSLRKAGASDGLIYKFLSDDANFYNIGGRCLMTSDDELDARYPETATAAVISDVRNGCLCRGREWFRAMLAPFVDAWNASPEFASSQFLWTYTDGLQRQITVSINDDVQTVLNQLDACP